MNYMKQVAQMLGVELGEEFKIEGRGGFYRLTKFSIIEWCLRRGAWLQMQEDFITFVGLITGEEKIIKLPKHILDDVEKRYLSNVIKPFRKDVKYIKKECLSGYEFIVIKISNGIEDGFVNLPSFEKGTMYKGMKVYKGYSLEKLGL